MSTIANRRLYDLFNGAHFGQSYPTLTCTDSKCFHCTSCLHLPFHILQVMTLVNVTKTQVTPGTFKVAGAIHTTFIDLNARFENTAFSLLCDHMHHSESPLAMHVVFKEQRCELKGVTGSCMSTPPLLLVTFSSQPFTSLVLHIDSCSI